MTGRMQDMKDARQEGCKTGIDARQQGCKIVRTQDRKDANQEGCKTRGIQDRKTLSIRDRVDVEQDECATGWILYHQRTNENPWREDSISLARWRWRKAN